MTPRVIRLIQRAELRPQVLHLEQDAWPPFMLQNSVLARHRDTLFSELAAWQLMLLDEHDQLLGTAYTIPLVWDHTVAGLPAGWDAAIEQGISEQRAGHNPTTLCALSVTVHP